MYEIKEEGFEYNGFKLGQMTNCGKIIGFDTNAIGGMQSIATNCDIDGHTVFIHESNYVTIILDKFEDSCFSWFNESDIETITGIIPTMQTQLNIIQQLSNKS